MRSSRLILAGVLLAGTVFLMTSLLTQPPYRITGVIAVAVFLPVWFTLCVINALGGIASGFPIRGEVTLAIVILAVPTGTTLLLWLASNTWWSGGPVVTTSRTPLFLMAGVALWGAVAVLTSLWPIEGRTRTLDTAAVVFGILWMAVTITNLLLGLTVGYTLLEELPVVGVTFFVPTAVAYVARLRPRSTPRAPL
ncbi:hypothetical protein [Streptomyces sp. KR55]|uniref:hypothetical protein n=1 Tax=Streptomyces sp. KR55 TaxID=3457425 RepID=UPI003FD3926E